MIFLLLVLVLLIALAGVWVIPAALAVFFAVVVLEILTRHTRLHR